MQQLWRIQIHPDLLANKSFLSSHHICCLHRGSPSLDAFIPVLCRISQWIEMFSSVTSKEFLWFYGNSQCDWFIKESGGPLTLASVCLLPTEHLVETFPLTHVCCTSHLKNYLMTFSHHHLGRYSCGSPLKFLLCRAWSTAWMWESIICLMSGVNGSKEGRWAPERLKCPSWLLSAHRNLSSVIVTFRKAVMSRSWGRRSRCSSS